jgi:hypothetical protein
MNGFLKAVEEDNFLQFKKINTFAAPFREPIHVAISGFKKPFTDSPVAF